MAKIMILRNYNRYPRIGETLGEGMIVEIKNLKLNNYQYLDSKGFKVVAEKIEQITHDSYIGAGGTEVAYESCGACRYGI